MAGKTEKTPEEIQAMRDEIMQYDQQQAQARADAMREAAKPLADLVDSDALKQVEEALPGLRQLAIDQDETLPYLGVYCDALRNGITGLRQLRGGIPGEQPDVAAPTADQPPASE